MLQAGGGGGGGYGGYGSYGSGTRRRLVEGYGGYGDAGGAGGYGAAPRQLREVDAAEQQRARERAAPAGAAAAHRADQQREAAAAAAGSSSSSSSGGADEQPAPSAAMAAALRSARAAAASSALAGAPGQCYCRYDADYNTFALGEEPCKQALYTKCRADQLSCGWLDAFYNHVAGAALAHTLPHEQDILAFVFDDCQPHPPCACGGVKFDGSDSGEFGGKGLGEDWGEPLPGLHADALDS